MRPSSRGPRRTAGLVILSVPLLLAACGGTSSASPAAPTPTAAPTAAPTPTSAPTSAPAAIVLQVTSEGGFINPSASLAALPTVVVYADGRILTMAAPPAELPDALLPRVEVRDVGASGASAIVTAIRAAGLDKASTADPGVSADSGTSVFAVSVDGSVVTTRFAANGPGGPGMPGGGGGSPERAAALDLLGRLLDTTDVWGASSPTDTVYAPSGYRVFAAPTEAATDPSTAIAWPLATDLASFGSPAVPDRGVIGLRSGVVLGADAATLGPVLAAAHSGAAFTSGGAAWMLFVRPLLPHELPG